MIEFCVSEPLNVKYLTYVFVYMKNKVFWIVYVKIIVCFTLICNILNTYISGGGAGVVEMGVTVEFSIVTVLTVQLSVGKSRAYPPLGKVYAPIPIQTDINSPATLPILQPWINHTQMILVRQQDADTIFTK